MTTYNIVVCSDKNYIPFVLVLFQSLFDNLRADYGTKGDKVNFHIILGDDVGIDEQKDLFSSFSARNSNRLSNEIFCYQVSNDFFKNCSEWGRVCKDSKGAYYRLLIDQIIPSDIDTVLYLDIDMLFRDDFRLIFDENDISEYLLGAVRDSGLITEDYPLNRASKAVLKFDLSQYINSGFLLLNLKACREIGFSDILVKFMNTHDLQYHDQTAINYVCYAGEVSKLQRFRNGVIKMLDIRFNFQQSIAFLKLNSSSGMYETIAGILPVMSQHFSSKEIIDAKNSMVLAHFNYSKPWSPKVIEFNELASFVVCPMFDDLANTWFEINNKTPECIVKYDLFINCERINSAFIEQRRLLKRRYRSNRKLIIAGISFLFILQILLFALSVILD